eukprot:scaffold144627_cov136-Phaeocystis_antarctica.AAC.1
MLIAASTSPVRTTSCLLPPTAYHLHPPATSLVGSCSCLVKPPAAPRTPFTPRIARRHTAHSRSRIIMASAERLDGSNDVDVSLRCLHGKPRDSGCCGLAHSTEVGSSRSDESLCSVRLGSARCRLVPARNDT